MSMTPSHINAFISNQGDTCYAESKYIWKYCPSLKSDCWIYISMISFWISIHNYNTKSYLNVCSSRPKLKCLLGWRKGIFISFFSKRSNSTWFFYFILCIDFIFMKEVSRNCQVFCKASSWLLSESKTYICFGFDSVNISSGWHEKSTWMFSWWGREYLHEMLDVWDQKLTGFSPDLSEQKPLLLLVIRHIFSKVVGKLIKKRKEKKANQCQTDF